MNMQEFAAALASKDVERYLAWFADDMPLSVPVYEEPIVGKQTACQILPIVFPSFENFHYPDIYHRRGFARANFRAEVAGAPLEGVACLLMNKRRILMI